MNPGKRSEDGSCVIALLVLILGFGGLNRLSELSSNFGLATSAFWFVSLGFAVVSIHRGRSLQPVVSNIGPELIGFTIFAMISTLWSISPVSTSYESLALAATCLLGGYLGATLGPARIALLGAWAATSVIAASLVLYSLQVRWARGDDGSIIGLLTHRNSVGAAAGLGLVISCSVPAVFRHRWIAIAVCGVGLLQSASRTSQVAAVVALLSVLLINLYRKAQMVGLAATLLTAAASTTTLIAFGGFGWVRSGLGKTSNLTGRTDIWRVVLSASARHRVGGLGFGAVWVNLSPVSSAIEFRFPGIVSSHNVFVETLASTGWIGLALLVLFFIGRINAVRLMGLLGSGAQRTAAAVLVFVAVRAIGEAGFPAKNSAALILMIGLFSRSGWHRGSNGEERAAPAGAGDGTVKSGHVRAPRPTPIR